jgi:hypothetical protein
MGTFFPEKCSQEISWTSAMMERPHTGTELGEAAQKRRALNSKTE